MTGTRKNTEYAEFCGHGGDVDRPERQLLRPAPAGWRTRSGCRRRRVTYSADPQALLYAPRSSAPPRHGTWLRTRSGCTGHPEIRHQALGEGTPKPLVSQATDPEKLVSRVRERTPTGHVEHSTDPQNLL
jgi:hypothetical protein